MDPHVTALLIHNRDDRFSTVKQVLAALQTRVIRARNCREAASFLCAVSPPELVLTDCVLPDGNWLDVLDLSAKAVEKVGVFVVSSVANKTLYSEVINAGAFDFITDSHTVSELVQVLKSARDTAWARRRGEPGPRAARETRGGRAAV